VKLAEVICRLLGLAVPHLLNDCRRVLKVAVLIRAADYGGVTQYAKLRLSIQSYAAFTDSHSTMTINRSTIHSRSHEFIDPLCQ
jgi:hypothetical protein